MSKQKPTVIIADDHPILLKGLGDLLRDMDLDVIAECPNGGKAITAIRTHLPELAILDLEMPELTGLEVAKICQSENIATKIILLTLHKELYLYHQAKELNLSGYILKEFALNDLSIAIHQVLGGKQFFSEKIFDEAGEISSQPSDENLLTPSEKKILRLIASGKASKDIAKKLFISERTVEKHRSNMIAKLKLEKKHNALLLWAQKNRDIID
ncbi:response regulator [Algoriphagus hitonicola]|uniref:Two component transcriptional regulator, LuxR family n=1 Tax=Algoriphagus hitonicola TaxID=435880 RepID=A0A1I2U5T6_9BACT|nr:response regulator transcription factor [Algoriphagus hitonicola]SFG72373.1 two component transcriptional regulator, LuxR family [Algoriphagus hitonicola]